MEMRSKKCAFLQEGDQLLLVATLGERFQYRRQILAVLEFQGCTRIWAKDLEKYFSLHQVTTEELQASKIQPAPAKAEDGGQRYWWGWHMHAHHIFDPPLVWHDSKQGPVNWCYISPQTLSLKDPEPRSASTSGFSESSSLKRSATMESDTSLSSPPGKKPRSQSESDEVQGFVPDLAGQEIPWDFSNPNEQVTCIVLSQKEWDGIAQDAVALLKPFRSRARHISALVKTHMGYSWVGVMTLKSIEPIDCAKCDLKSLLGLTKGIYSKPELSQKKGSKNLFLWKCEDIIILTQPVPLTWVDNSWRNRTFVMAASRLKAATHLAEATSMDLKATCSHFLQCCDPIYRDKIFEMVKHLSGRTLRLATACSGTDICITVIKQTLQQLNQLQAGPLYFLR
eukprot:s1634_g15.t1